MWTDERGKERCEVQGLLRVSREGMSLGKNGRSGKGGEDEKKEGWKEQDKEKRMGEECGEHIYIHFPFLQTSQQPF